RRDHHDLERALAGLDQAVPKLAQLYALAAISDEADDERRPRSVKRRDLRLQIQLEQRVDQHRERGDEEPAAFQDPPELGNLLFLDPPDAELGGLQIGLDEKRYVVEQGRHE